MESAGSAIGKLGAARDKGDRAQACDALRADARLADEVDHVLAAVTGRFGAEGLRTFERGSVPEGATVLPAGCAAFAEVGRAVTALRSAWPRASARGRERRSKL